MVRRTIQHTDRGDALLRRALVQHSPQVSAEAFVVVLMLVVVVVVVILEVILEALSIAHGR